jgi:hypothetical protein
MWYVNFWFKILGQESNDVVVKFCVAFFLLKVENTATYNCFQILNNKFEKLQRKESVYMRYADGTSVLYILSCAIFYDN